MIDLKELRIGNYVWDNYSGYMIVASISLTNNYSYVDLRKNENKPLGQYNLDSIYPVLITEQLLIKAGFGKDEYDFWEYDLGNEDNVSVNLDYNTHIYCQIGNDITWTNGIKLKGFHHLQNIVFDLSGKELKVSF